MPNSYTVIPNILPGNVTIGGILTVSGDIIRIGAAAPFVRVGKTLGGNMMLSTNLGQDQATRDNAGQAAWSLLNPANTMQDFHNRLDSAGNLSQTSNEAAFYTDYVNHFNNNNVILVTIYSKIIRGGFIGANSGMLMQMRFSSSVQGAVSTVFTVNLGATTLHTGNIIAAASGHGQLYELFMHNQGAANVQNGSVRVTDLTTFAIACSTFNTAVDTSVDQTFTVKVQNGAVTDNNSWNTISLRLINFIGPL